MITIATALINGQSVTLREKDGFYFYTFTAQSQNIEIEHFGCIGDTKITDILLEKRDAPTLSPEPLDFSTSDSTDAEYIGIAITDSVTDPTDKYAYAWTLIKGHDGADGLPGPKGSDGRTSYLHIAYATNETGTAGFSITDSVGKTYIGQYTDFTQSDSTDPSRYKWSRMKGDKGEIGQTGPKGDPGAASYTHIAFSNSADGSIGFSLTDGKSKLYQGFMTSNSPTPSSNYRDYKWQRTSDGYNADMTAANQATQEYIQSIQGEVQKLQQAQAALAAASEISKLQSEINALKTSMASDKRTSEANLSSALSKLASVENSLGDMAERWKFIDVQMQMSNEGFLIGNQSKGTYLLQKDDRISFFNNGSEVAFISGGMLQITQAVFVQRIQIAEYMLGAYDNDPEILIIKHVGRVTS